MADYFGYKDAGMDASTVLTFDNALLQINGGTASLVQSLSIQYRQGVTPMYEIGSNKVYYVSGHPQGSGQIGRVISNKNRNDFDNYTNICNPKTVTINAQSSSCSDTTPYKLTMKGFVVTDIAFSMQAGQAVMNENVSFMFASLEKN